ncbi:hypothetical protein AVEN_196305-1 [Araneus ventricosus]|uniref:DUF5641 domain-containing protein n=1 Tax=Araneus ventricosus TaxID=182803 RepID=A0A4Y2LMK8_ARAVE|nr:hypothetical protein AVEN_196305-1 [Araneus ventricosus]
MHVFVDACKEAYSTYLFLRSDTYLGVKVVLGRTKSRVAPLEQVTIPRLELMGCCIGARRYRLDWGRCERRLQWPLASVIELIPRKDRLVRTVKLKTEPCTLIRPIQRVFLLELSGNGLTSLPLQKVQLTEPSVNPPNPDSSEASVKSPIPDSLKASVKSPIPDSSEASVKSPIPDSSKTNQPQMIRCGRTIKRPKRPNLVILTDVFE